VSTGLPTAEEAVKVLAETFSRMGYAARLDAKEAEDGSISVAVQLDGELPGAPAGKRGSVLEAVQYLVNKRLNRAPDVRRWINLGLGEHPAPRGARPPKPSAPPAVPAASPAPPPVPRPAQRPARASQVDEAKLPVAPDEHLAAAARALAEAAGRLGRTYALLGMGAEDRARVLQAAQGVPGMSARAEGEGRNRRVTLLPEKPTPMPRQRLPGLDEDELEELDGEGEADEG
jgi:predicted RNA-binding protein Jag